MEKFTMQEQVPLGAQNHDVELGYAENALYEAARESHDPTHAHRQALHDVIQNAKERVWERLGIAQPAELKVAHSTVSHVWGIADDLKQEDRIGEFNSRCHDAYIDNLKATSEHALNGNLVSEPALEIVEVIHPMHRLTAEQRHFENRGAKERKAMNMPLGLYNEQPSQLNVILAFEWTKDLLSLGPESLRIDPQCRHAIQAWENLYHGKAIYNERELYLICEAACYQKDELSRGLFLSAQPQGQQTAFKSLGRAPAEHHDFIEKLRGLQESERPYLHFTCGHIPISWPAAVGRSISLKVECHGSAVVLPLGGGFLTGTSNHVVTIPAGYLSPNEATSFTILIDTIEGSEMPDEKPRIFTVHTRTPTTIEFLDAIRGGLSRRDHAFERYERLVGEIAHNLEQ